MELKCINKKCLYQWDYKGRSKNYVSCPMCLYRFKIQRAIDNMLTYPDNIHNNIVHNIPLKEPQTIEEEIDEEEILDQEELFTEIIMKLCKKHNLPGRYDDYDLEWKCKECIELQIENVTIPKILTNILHANFIDVGDIRIREIKSSPQINQLSYPIPLKDSSGDRLISS